MARARAVPAAAASASRNARRAPPPARAAKGRGEPRPTSTPTAAVPDAAPLVTASSAPPCRVASIAIKANTFKMIRPPPKQLAVLRGVLDRCVVPAEQRTHAHIGGDTIPAATTTIDVEFPWERAPANTPILGPLTTDYPAQARSLQVLTIVHNAYDESAALGAFAALATRLQELTFRNCGLTSINGLVGGRCEYLRNVTLVGLEQLTNIDVALLPCSKESSTPLVPAALLIAGPRRPPMPAGG